jgi:hypothetical protein
MAGSGDLYAPPPHLAQPLLLTFGEGRAEGRQRRDRAPLHAPPDLRERRERHHLRERSEGMAAARGRGWLRSGEEDTT